MLPVPSVQRFFCENTSADSAGSECSSFASALLSFGLAACREPFPSPRLRFGRIDLRGIPDFDRGAETLVVFIMNSHANVHVVAGFEVQHVIGARVRGEPVVPFRILAKVLEMREGLVFLFLEQTRGCARGLHNL